MGNIVSIHLEQPGKPRIHMMTEAGIIGKIGLNSSGVGVTLNAVKAKGVDFARLPCHLALRKTLESESCADAQQALEKAGVAAACHILVADSTSSVGLECTASDIVPLYPAQGQKTDHKGGNIITHTNHFIKPHKWPDCPPDMPDSPFRLERINELLEDWTKKPSFETIGEILKDEDNFPGSICRALSEEDGFATLFSIIMDLNNYKAEVKMGRPTEPFEQLILKP
jgi:isopenicillin-N N-acyltransferase like protein